MVGKLLGQNLFDKAKEYGKKFCHISIWAGIVHMALLCILGPIVAEFFVLSETAKHYLVIMLVFSAFYVFAYSINTVIVCGISLQAVMRGTMRSAFSSPPGALHCRWHCSELSYFTGRSSWYIS